MSAGMYRSQESDALGIVITGGWLAHDVMRHMTWVVEWNMDPLEEQ